jgi:hypothetical protein
VSCRRFAHIGHLTEMWAEIGRLTDAPDRRRGHDPLVEITIRLDGIDPPMGRVSLAAGVEVEFVGWLGLLRVLSEMLEAESGELPGGRRRR